MKEAWRLLTFFVYVGLFIIISFIISVFVTLIYLAFKFALS